MNKIHIESLEKMKRVINEWKNQRLFTYENKQLVVLSQHTFPGESVLKFTNEIHGFSGRDGIEIPISLASQLFLTTTLSEKSFSENSNSDASRLTIFLEDFDREFYGFMNKRIAESIDGETFLTTDPLLWQL